LPSDLLTLIDFRGHSSGMTLLADPVEFFGAEPMQDPYPLYDRLRAEAPVHRVADSPFFVVCSWDAVVEAIERVEDFSSNLTATMVYQADGTVTPFEMDALDGPSQVLATADDPAHAVHRKLLVPQLAGRKIRALEVFVAQTAEGLWGEAVNDHRVEWMTAMANRLPMMVVTRLIGVPEADVDQLAQWAYRAPQLLDGLVSEGQLAAAGMAAMELAVYLAERFEEATADPKDNLLGDLAMARASGELSEITAHAIMITLFSAGGESTASL